jgi:probable phosphoglycerate mutase
MELYVDGSTQETCFVLGKESKVITNICGKTTGNVGEYHALIHGLQEAKNHGVQALQIFSDSELMVNQLKTDKGGMPIYACKNERLRSLRIIVLELLTCFKDTTITWIPRKSNKAGQILEKIAQDRRKHAIKNKR